MVRDDESWEKSHVKVRKAYLNSESFKRFDCFFVKSGVPFCLIDMILQTHDDDDLQWRKKYVI